MVRTLSALLVALLAATCAAAQPAGGAPHPEEVKWRAERRAELAQLLPTLKGNGPKVDAHAKLFAKAGSPEFAHEMLAGATRFPCAELDKFLARVLKDHPDAELRGAAARHMGRAGSEECFENLLEAAIHDKASVGVVGGDQPRVTSARGPALLAVADLAERHALIKNSATNILQKITPHESAADAHKQALYRLTGKAELLKGFTERLSAPRPADRRAAALAFAELRLKEAPKELVAALADKDADVRAGVAWVLGGIADPKTGAALFARAFDGAENFGVRSFAVQALGAIKHAPAKGPLRELAESKDPLRWCAATAYFQITGEKLGAYVEPKE